MIAQLVRRTGISVDELLSDPVVCEALWDQVVEEDREAAKEHEAARRRALQVRLRGAMGGR